MKRLLLIISMALVTVTGALAQFTPTTMWPYVYEDFSEGMIFYRDGTANKAQVNIHLNAGELQFLKGDVIMTRALDDVDFVVVNNEKFVPANGQMMKVLSENLDSRTFVLSSVLADLDALYSGTGAYGSNANTQSVKNQTSVELGGIMVNSHAKLLEEKKNDSGSLLSTKEKMFIKVDETDSPAFQSDVENAFSLKGNGDWKSFLKQEKIKWRKPADLQKVADYLSTKK